MVLPAFLPLCLLSSSLGYALRLSARLWKPDAPPVLDSGQAIVRVRRSGRSVAVNRLVWGVVAVFSAFGLPRVRADIIVYTGPQGPNLALHHTAPTATATAATNQLGHGGDGFLGAIDGNPGTIWHGWNTGNGSAAWWQMSWTGGPQTFNRIRLLSSLAQSDGHHGSAGTVGNFQLFVDGNLSTPLVFANNSTTAFGSGTFDLKNPVTATTIRVRWTSNQGGLHGIINEFEVYNVAEPPDGDTVYLPADANLINVKTAYGAVGNGVHDDTQAIQNAVTANVNSHKTLYFPPGVYRISNTIDFRRPDGKYGALITIQGAGRGQTVIRLADGVFTSTTAPKPMIKMGSIDSTTGAGNRAHANYVFDLTLHTGSNNPGAVGLDYNGSNVGAVFRVNIISGDGQGDTGLKLTAGVGPASFKELLIDGFNRGIHTQQLFFGMGFEHITLKNQKVVGFLNDGNTVAVRRLVSHNNVTAFHSRAWHATAVLMDSELHRTGGTQPAIRHEGGSLTVRNVTNQGYATAIQAPTGQSNITGTHIAEYIGASDPNNGPLSLFGDTPAKTLNVQIQETPTFWTNNPAQWANVTSYGAMPNDNGNDTAAVAAAMQAGKPVVYFPRGTYDFDATEIVVPEGVRLIAGFGSFAKGIRLRFVNHTQPVIVDRLNGTQGQRGLLRLQGTGAVVFKHGSEMETDLSSGPRILFLEDVVARPLVIGADDVVYARGLNIEHPGPNPMILNDGGFLWSLFYKTEHGNTVLHARNGAETEIMAGFFYPAQGVPSPQLLPLTREQVPMILNENSWLSLSYTHRGSSTAAYNYFLHLRDVRGNTTLQHTRGNGHQFRALLFSNPPAVQTTGTVDREYWTGITGKTIASLTGNARFPNQPTGTGTLNSLQAVSWNNPAQTTNWDNNYGQRIRGYLIPPVSGQYTFWITGDDHAEFWLGTNSSPASKVRLAHVPGHSLPTEWNKYTAQKSAPITLEAGTWYYLEVLHKEESGGDHVAVGWLKPGESGSIPSQIVPGSVLSSFSGGAP